MQYRMILAASLAMATAVCATPARPQITKAPRAEHLRSKRQQPNPAGKTVLDAPMTIGAGEKFDGGNAVFDRGTPCSGQKEGGSSDAVFILEKGASLSNVIIGPDQAEGVHCQGSCTLTNVWWEAVCEDAFTIKEQGDGETTTINGGGAKGADDKVIQHNGGGTVVINDFTVSDFGKLYRSCGNCKSMPARHVRVSGGSASNGDLLVGINSNMGDTASISGISTSGVKDQCTDFEGVTDGSEPKKIGPCGNTSGGGGSGGSPANPPEDDEPSTSAPPSRGPSPSAAPGGDDEDEPSTTSSVRPGRPSPSAAPGGDDEDADQGDDSGSGGDDQSGDDNQTGDDNRSGNGRGN